MHNTPQQNLEFQLNFCENNLRYLLGDETPDQKKIEYMRKEIKRIKKKLKFDYIDSLYQRRDLEELKMISKQV
jgi:aryl-alcohol dehydrogenase-like predicted oxidoreductase